MTQSLEQILAQAEAELRRTGTLNRQALLSAHPAEAAELAPLLETMLLLHEEKTWQRVERRSRSAAQSLFAALTAPASEVATVGALFAQDRSESGLSVAEQASRSGLPEEALRRLDQVQTPLEALQSNTAIKALAEQVKAPFAALAKEIRRLLSIQSLSSGAPGSAVFTRNAETSSSEEQQALLEKIRQEARRGKKDE
jgi:hypothetical protein